MEHQILLRFSDGETRPLTVGHGGNLLEAALNSGLALLNQCKTGSCSTCVCKAAEGDLRIEANTSVALIPSEIASGTRLSCVTKVYSDGVVELPYEVSELDRDGPTKFEGEIVGIERLNDSVVHLSIDAPDMPGFEAGEYFTIKVPGREVSRAYSPSTRPAENPSLEFLIRLQPNGAMSGYLAEEVCEGDVLSLEGPFGEFKWNKTKNPIIFVAGGTGLAPVLSMLNTISVERRHRERILLCFGVNKHNELFYQEELDYLQQMMPRLEVRISVVEPSEEWDGPTGHVTGLITESDVKPNTEAFLCGPPPMVAAATELLKGFGLDANAIKAERFSMTTEMQ